jgi:hypothetical protein
MVGACGTTAEHSRGIAEQDWRDGRDERGLIWFIWSIWFNQTNETDQINKKDQPVLALHAARSRV